MNNIKLDTATRRRKRIRAKVNGTSERPRFSFTKTNSHLYGQLIDDTVGKTVAFVSTLKMDEKLSKKEKAIELGRLIAEEAKKQKIKKVVFDRGTSAYTGIVKECAESARKGGLEF